MAVKSGKTVFFENRAYISAVSSSVGKKEGEGPFGNYFDYVSKDSRFGQKTYEQAESEMQKITVRRVLQKAGKESGNIDVICAGDLLNQCIGSSFGLKELNIPIIGVYGACSTMALSLITVANMIESGAADIGISVTSSHFCSAERQYRFPLEYGSQRPMTSQWTVTGCGAMLLNREQKGAYIHSARIGKICDLGIKDQNNMGAAMAPAAADTIVGYLRDTDTVPSDYDVIFTGDLGFTGTELLYRLAEEESIRLEGHHADFGKMIFDRERQDVHSGGSGCGCSASLLCSYVMDMFEKGKYKNILYCATGALLSPTSVLQKLTVPAVAHLVNIRI